MNLLVKLNNTLKIHKKAKDSKEFVHALQDIIYRLEIISYTEIIKSEHEEKKAIEKISKDLEQTLLSQEDKEKSELVKLQLSILSMLGPSKQ